MDKEFFENMDNRFKSIENELKFSYDDKFWEQAEAELNNSDLDNAFVNAAQHASVLSNINFDEIDDAFLDDAFINAADKTIYTYQPSYWNEFTKIESTLYYNDAFVTAAALSQAVYDVNYWKDADLALQAEGLHHEYKPEYWAEAEKLLIKDARKGFFFKWSVAATILLLFSFFTYKITNIESTQIVKTKNTKVDEKLITNKNQSIADNSKSNSFVVKDNSNTSHSENNQVQFENKNSKLSNKNQPLESNGVDDAKNNDIVNKEKLNSNDKSENINHIEKSQEKLTQEETIVAEDVSNNTVVENGSQTNHSDLRTNNPNQSNDNVTNNSKLSDDVVLENRNIEHKKIDFISLNRKDLTHIPTESNHAKIEGNRIDVSKLDLKPMHVFSVELAKGIGNNFSGNNNLSFRNSIYLSYKLVPFKSKFKSFNFGLDAGIYHQNLNDYVYESNYSVYRLNGDVDHYWYKIEYKDLVYFSAKPTIYYNLNSKHTFKLALGIDKLATSRLKMQYKINEDLSDENTEQWGISEGFSDIDFSVNLGYEFLVSPNFSFTINAKQGIVDKTDNDYLNKTDNDNDRSLLLGLKYTFFRK